MRNSSILRSFASLRMTPARTGIGAAAGRPYGNETDRRRRSLLRHFLELDRGIVRRLADPEAVLQILVDRARGFAPGAHRQDDGGRAGDDVAAGEDAAACEVRSVSGSASM